MEEKKKKDKKEQKGRNTKENVEIIQPCTSFHIDNNSGTNSLDTCVPLPIELCDVSSVAMSATSGKG